jgi:hypothetical protein
MIICDSPLPRTNRVRKVNAADIGGSCEKCHAMVIWCTVSDNYVITIGDRICYFTSSKKAMK